MIDIGTALQRVSEQLGARIDAELLLMHSLKQSRSYLYAYPEYQLTSHEAEFFKKLVDARQAGMPIAYLVGTREFWSLSLEISQATLIPRPETEVLVETCLALAPKGPLNILDLGTGSGAIALALAKERPQWQITASDNSRDALLIAEKNAKRLGVTNVQFYQSDWFMDLPEKKYHVIVSNPPYIPENDLHLEQGDLRFEPKEALVSGKNGLEALHYIIKHSYDYLLQNGLVLLEHGHDQKTAVETILNETGYTEILTWKDWQGHDRVTGGRY